MIEFYQNIKGQKVYVAPVGFKSYAQYYYFEQTEEANVFKKIQDEKFGGEPTLYTPLEVQVREFMMNGDIEYDAYFVTKIQHIQLDTLPQIEHLYSKGGYKFYKRDAVK